MRRALLTLLASPALLTHAQEQSGSIRGVIYDKDFGAPLARAGVMAVELGRERAVQSTDQGNYVLADLAPGAYTLVFSKEGYVRQVKSDVVVRPGQLTEVDIYLAGDFTEMEEFVVQDLLQLGAASEAALLELRFESPALMDSISSELMGQAGASDAATALRLVAGASLQDGKFAVIRGLPDRYVSSQMNGVRLPTADEDKRAVELDQFPAAVIDSIQVSKTFTPDQQGDASGGAVDLRLRGVPEESVLSFGAQLGYNTSVAGSDFLGYEGGGINFWGHDDGGRDVQTGNLGSNWDGAVGVSEIDAPVDYKYNLDIGGKRELDGGLKIGAFASLFYERDSSFFDDGIDNSLWAESAGAPLTPETIQGTVQDGNFKTALFDVTQAAQSVRYGGLGTLGLESERNSVGFTVLYTHTAEDKATLAEDTRGKEFFFPGYDPDDPFGAGNIEPDKNTAPYIRTETLEYTERTTATFQLGGEHRLAWDGPDLGPLDLGEPELSWTAALSTADLDQPDKRQFGSLFLPDSFNPGTGVVDPSVWLPYKPSANFTVGNFQRIFKTIDETSHQYALDLKLPFEQWDDQPGYVKLGWFSDSVDRVFDQDTFSNFSDTGAQFPGDFDDFWSAFFPFEDHPITDSLFDVDYDGTIDVSATYGMIDLPLSSRLDLIGGARLESTDIRVVNDAEPFALWFRPGASAPESLDPGEADVDFSQDDVLPSVGLTFQATPELTLRAGYSETVARQTFKELTPILQQEYLGGPVFIGNPTLDMSALKNYDLRLDYTPYPGGLASLSYFYKDIEDPIEYVQRLVNFTFTTPVNYPHGRLSGFELELRQALDRLSPALEGLSLGGNATLIDASVELSADEVLEFANLGLPITERDMTNAPEYLYNLYATYDVGVSDTQVALFYTVQGDTLLAGAGTSLGKFVPDVYAKEYGTLNLSLSTRLTPNMRLRFQAKNLTDPAIETVYRSDFTGPDATKTSYTKGREFSIALSFNL